MFSFRNKVSSMFSAMLSSVSDPMSFTSTNGGHEVNVGKRIKIGGSYLTPDLRHNFHMPQRHVSQQPRPCLQCGTKTRHAQPFCSAAHIREWRVANPHNGRYRHDLFLKQIERRIFRYGETEKVHTHVVRS